MLPASLCAKIMVFRRITRIIEVVLNERAVTPRSITLKNGHDMLYVIGNFGEEDANAISLPDGIQYNYMTGEEVSGNITVPAHSFFLGTSFMPQ